MIDTKLTGGDAVVARLNTLGPRIDAALDQAAAAAVERLRDRVDRNLSGDVLDSRTGTLRASLITGARTAGGISATLRATAPYAAFQEYGFQGTEPVRAYLRRQSQAFGRAISPRQIAVRAHDRRIDYPGRSFLGSAFDAETPNVTDGFAAAIDGVVSP